MNKKIIYIVILSIFLLSSFNVVGVSIKTQNTEEQSFVEDSLGPLDDSECWLTGANHVETEGRTDYVMCNFLPPPYNSYWGCELSEFEYSASATYEFNILGSEVTKVGIYYVEESNSVINQGPSLYIYNYKSEKWDVLKENIGLTGYHVLRLVNISVNYNDGYIKRGDTNTPDKVRIKVYAEENWGWPIPLAGDFTDVILIGVYYKPRLSVPDLECENNVIAFGEKRHNTEVSSVIKIKNVGDYQSNLNWKVELYPVDWGTWTFESSSGTGLTPQDVAKEIKFSVVVPKTKGSYSGTIKIVNTDDPSDFEEIIVGVTSTKKARAYAHQLLLCSVIDQFLLLKIKTNFFIGVINR